MKRFVYDTNNLEDARSYILSRAKQLLRLFYKLVKIEEYEWGIDATFKKDGKTYQSIYILKDYQGKGLYKTLVRDVILTSNMCNIVDYLDKNNIEYVCENLNPDIEYQVISDFYEGDTAKRSGVQLMNHIDEGLYILNKIGASDIAKRAYCIHPILQSDEMLSDNFSYNMVIAPLRDPLVLIAAMEYRSVANEYLSKKEIASIDEIRLSPLKDVNDMLIADKIQNRKDFELYHLDKHPRSKELELYFKNWMDRLGIDENLYQEIKNDLKDEFR